MFGGMIMKLVGYECKENSHKEKYTLLVEWREGWFWNRYTNHGILKGTKYHWVWYPSGRDADLDIMDWAEAVVKRIEWGMYKELRREKIER
jgi:hypothetical protein